MGFLSLTKKQSFKMQKAPALEVIACVNNDMCCSGFPGAVARFDERFGKKSFFVFSVFYYGAVIGLFTVVTMCVKKASLSACGPNCSVDIPQSVVVAVTASVCHGGALSKHWCTLTLLPLCFLCLPECRLVLLGSFR